MLGVGRMMFATLLMSAFTFTPTTPNASIYTSDATLHEPDEAASFLQTHVGTVLEQTDRENSSSAISEIGDLQVGTPRVGSSRLQAKPEQPGVNILTHIVKKAAASDVLTRVVSEASSSVAGPIYLESGIVPIEKPADAFRSFMVGEIKVHRIFDFGNVQPYAGIFPDVFMSNPLALPVWNGMAFGLTLVQCPGSPGTNIVLDTGMGEPTSTIDVRKVFEAIGLSPSDVDYVALSHLDDDHTGWNTVVNASGQRVPFFSNAKYVVQLAEWSYVTSSEALKESHKYEERFGALVARGMMQIVDGPHTLCPGVSLQLATGHTAGHQVTFIESVVGGERRKAVFMGDAIHTPPEVEHPDWSPVWDWAPHISALVRKNLLKSISEENALMIVLHFPFPGVGRVTSQNGTFSFHSIAESMET